MSDQLAILPLDDYDACVAAIKAKLGNNDPIKSGQLAAKVAAIVTGSAASGTLNISENGTYDVTNYASAVVNVAGGASVPSAPQYISLDPGEVPEVYAPYLAESKLRLAERYPDAEYKDIVIIARPPFSLSAPEPFSRIDIFYLRENFSVISLGSGGYCNVTGCYTDRGGFAQSGDASSFRWEMTNGQPNIRAALLDAEDVHIDGYLSMCYNDTAAGSPSTLTARDSMGWIRYSTAILHYDELLLYPNYRNQDVAGRGALTYAWDSATGTLTLFASAASAEALESSEEENGSPVEESSS